MKKLLVVGMLISALVGIMAPAFMKADRQQPDLLFQIVHRDSPKHLVEAAQAELCRIQLYRGPVDGICGPATLESEVKYLALVIEGEKFKSFEVR